MNVGNQPSPVRFLNCMKRNKAVWDADANKSVVLLKQIDINNLTQTITNCSSQPIADFHDMSAHTSITILLPSQGSQSIPQMVLK